MATVTRLSDHAAKRHPDPPAFARDTHLAVMATMYRTYLRAEDVPDFLALIGAGEQADGPVAEQLDAVAKVSSALILKARR